MKVIIPLPSLDFDPTEVSVPWKILKQKGKEIHNLICNLDLLLSPITIFLPAGQVMPIVLA